MQEEKTAEYREDGYKNLMNKYGTSDDVSEHYKFESGETVTDVELTLNYEENGLFTKIIDIPADDAVIKGFDYNITDTDITTFINDSLDELDFEEKAATAIKWSRLYGGALIVMVIDDGGELSDPVNWDDIRGIDELLVFERPLITPDYSNIYDYKPGGKKGSKFGMPKYYEVSPIYGSQFKVHESRCLLFKNGILPSISLRTEYRFFGIPEYIRINKSLQETVTTHGNGPKLLDRAVQAIYKMNGLASLLETDEGEDIVLKRLQLIDMAKGIINSIAIDADGEDYDFKGISFSGVKDIIDSTCNMLSAVTNIPQTKLFGRSPAGENSTGDGDMENYYKFVEKIQNLNLKKNLGTLIDIILLVGKFKGEFEDVPDYKLKFNPLWSLSETEQAGVDQTKAQTELVKAQTAQTYVDMQALDASEVRKRLAENGEFTVNDILEEEDWGEFEEENTPKDESQETSNTALSAEQEGSSKSDEEMEMDSVTPTGCGVIVVKDGKVLIGKRKDNGLICGPGGHIENGETPEEAAVRETREEFGINIGEIIPITLLGNMPKEYCPSQVYLCTEFYGTPVCFNTEMENAQFVPFEHLIGKELFLPFALSIKEFLNMLKGIHSDGENADDWITVNGQHIEVNESGELISGNPKVLGGNEKGVANRGKSGNIEIPKDSNGKAYSKPTAENLSPKEISKVGHDINNAYHSRFKGKRRGIITTYNPDDDKAYDYKFECHGFNEYNIFSKTENER